MITITEFLAANEPARFDPERGKLGDLLLEGRVPTGANLWNGQWTDKQAGLGIGTRDERVRSIFACANDGYRGYSTYAGPVLVGDRELRLRRDLAPQSIRDLVQHAPISDWDDGSERCITYQIGGVELEFSWWCDEFVYIISEVFTPKT